MKLILVLISGLLVTVPSAASAQAYVGAHFGLAVPADMDITTPDNHVRVEHADGFDTGGVIGYDLGMFRLEAEGFYSKSKIIRQNQFTNIAPPQEVFGGTVNALIDIPLSRSTTFFAGPGIGLAKVFSHAETGPNCKDPLEVRTNSSGRRPNGSCTDQGKSGDTGLLWQVSAGLRHKLTSHIDLGVRYAMRNATDITTATSFKTFNAKGKRTYIEDFEQNKTYRSHSALVTLGYNF